MESRQFTGLPFDNQVGQLTVGQLLSQNGTEDMEVAAFIGTVGYFIKEADMPLMAKRAFYLRLLACQYGLQV